MMSKINNIKSSAWVLGFMAVLLFLWGAPSQAAIQGIDGSTFTLVAKPGHIVTSDGDSFLMWGYAGPSGVMQYPGPTLIVNQGSLVTVNLTNTLPVASSIVFPGHNVSASGGNAGLLTQESTSPTDTVTYTFTATHPGTYLYHSGTRPDLQVEMGLVGAIIVRPSMGANYAYNHADTAFDREFLYLVTEMDPLIHRQVEFGQMDQIDTSAHFATNWFTNGRNFPDNMADNFVPWLPRQPYNCQPRMHPGEKVLVRLIGAGVELHPMHLHGNDFDTIAADGRLLSSAPGAGPDLAWKATTIRTVPGHTADVMWTWTGEKLGWDIYGDEAGDLHPAGSAGAGDPFCAEYDAAKQALIDAGVAPEDIPDNLDAYPGLDPALVAALEDAIFDSHNFEYCPDHGVPFPVILPTRDSVTFGPFYPGSPFLGGEGQLAPGDPGLNANAGFFYMWHSHTEKELTSNDIWPGGLVTFLIVEHPDVPLP